MCCTLEVRYLFHIKNWICVADWKMDMCYRLKIQYSCCILKMQYLLYIKNSIFVANWKFNLCCTLKVRDVLHIENVSSPLSSFAHQLTFPLATHRHRRRSLFWPSTRQKTTITKNCQLKVSIPKNSIQMINYQLLLFPLHSVAASRRSLLCPDLRCGHCGDIQFRVRQVQFLFCD